MADEYIRKADAIRWVKTECNPYGRPTLDYESGIRVMVHLKHMPPADVVQVVHGRWIDDGTEFGCQCSECGKTLDDYVAPTEYASLNEIPNFCPNCGAKMDAQGEE